MKVLLISSSNNIKNGVGNMTHELCSSLKGKADITLLLPKSAPRYDYVDYKVEYVLPEYIFDMKTPKVLDFLFFKYPGTFDFDFVHSIFEFPYALIGSHLARKHKVPFIIGTQGTYAIKPLFEFPQKYLMKRIYRTATRIVTASVFTRDALLKYTKTNRPIRLIHNGVNFKRFTQVQKIDDIRAKYPDKQLLLTVGGFKPRKGQDIVLDALCQVKKVRSDFHYLIVGPYENRDTYIDLLHKITKEGNLEDNVTFVGECSDADIVRYFHACDIYIHTTRVIHWNYEGFGIVYLEAGASGKPSIAARAGGAPDAVVDGKTGLVVPEGDVNATATAILSLLAFPEKAREFGAAGIEYAREHDWSIIAQKYFDLYLEVVAEKNKGKKK